MASMLEDEQKFRICLTNEDPCTRNPNEVQFKLLIPTLEHMASVKLAIALWLQKFKENISSCGLFIQAVVRDLEDEVLDDASALAIPTLLKQKLSLDVIQVGNEMEDFILFFSPLFSDALRISWLDVESIIWTSRGNIDRINTAEVLRKDDRMYLIDKEEIQDKINNHYEYGINNLWDHRFENSLCMTKLLFNQHHPLMVDYFNYTENERRIAIILSEWLYAIFQCTTCDACFLLAKCSEGVLKCIIFEEKLFWLEELCGYFLQKQFQNDYFLQFAAMVCDIAPNFDLKNIAKKVVTKLNDLKETPLAYDAYITFYDRFTAVLSRNLTEKNEFAYYYLLLYRLSGNYEQVQSILSQLDPQKSKELLLFNDGDIFVSILFANGLDRLKSCFELIGIVENVIMVRDALKWFQLEDICYHYFETNDFDGFSKLLVWLSEGIQEKLYKLKMKTSSKCLPIFIKKDCRQFVKSYYRKGRYPGIDEMFCHSTDSFLNWIWQNDDSTAVKFCKERHVESTKNVVASMFSPSLPFLPDAKHYNEFNDRMILWMYDNDSEKFESLKNTPQYKIYCNQNYYLTQCVSRY